MLPIRHLIFMIALTVLMQPAGAQEPTPTPNINELRIDLPGQELNTIPLTLVRIPAGSFIMGDPSGEDETNVQHPVTLTQDFYIGKYEVTNAQWEALGVLPVYENYYRGPNQATVMSWDRANLFLSRLNELGIGYFRFPTEAEWEYACRAGTTTRFYWGDEASLETAEKYGWFHLEEEVRPREVGQKIPNQWGLFDMHGNAGEWCVDYFHPLDSAEAVVNPVNLTPNELDHHTARGEAVRVHPQGAHFRYDPLRQFLHIGLRVVMVENAPEGTPTPTFTPTPTATPTRTPTPTITPIPTFIPEGEIIGLGELPNAYEPLKYIDINIDSGEISEPTQIGVRAGLSFYSDAVNETGDILFISGTIVRLLENGLGIHHTPEYFYRDLPWLLSMSPDGETVMYQPGFGRNASSFIIFDWVNGIITHHHFDFSRPGSISASDNLNTLAIAARDDTRMRPWVSEKDDIGYPEPTLLSGGLATPNFPHPFLLSSSGDRIFLKGWTIEDEFFEKTSDGWVEKKLLDIPGADSAHTDSFVQIANNGRFFLIRDESNGYGVVHETADGFSKVDWLGVSINNSFSRKPISENGRVVVLISRDIDVFNRIHILVRTQTHWTHETIEIDSPFGLRDYLLSGDGSRLFWAPQLEKVSINDWKLH